MIEINVARDLLYSDAADGESSRGHGWIYVVLCLAMAVSSWWWTQNKQLEVEFLLQEKDMQAQSLVKIQKTLSRLELYQEEKKLLRRAVEERQVQQLGKQQPMVLLQGVQQSIDGLGIWLDHVQMADQAVEIRGQSFSYQEIEKYIDSLGNHQVMMSLPVVEILDHVDSEGTKIFSFVIRFVLESQVTA